ncbi:hypothetical protein MMC09_004912 [Bachmanniomyces sp. S44760]|nr:hypothetical protein [Bachmanniomyces sp. S44760]
MLYTIFLAASVFTFAQATGDCFSWVHGSPPAYSPVPGNCQNAVQRILREAAQHPEPVIFDSAGGRSRKLPYTWFNVDCAIMINTLDYPRSSGPQPILLKTVADIASHITQFCLFTRGWQIGGDMMIAPNVVVSVAGLYPALVAIPPYFASAGGLNDTETGTVNGMEPLSSSSTLRTIATPGAATS